MPPWIDLRGPRSGNVGDQSLSASTGTWRNLAGWRPDDSANVLAWLDPQQNLTLVSGAASSWASRVGSVTAAQGTAATRPAYGASALSGQPGLTFDGVDDFMSISGLSAASGDVLVAMALAPAALVDGWVLDIQTGRLACIYRDATNTGGNVGWFDGAFKNSAGAPTTGAQILVFDLRVSPGGRIYRNGAQIGATQAYTANAIGGAIGLGSTYLGASAWFNGVMGDVVVATSPTDTLRALITGYLGAKYGVSTV